MSMGNRGMESAATDEGKDRGVHYSDRLGRDTKSMGDRGIAGGMESAATDEGKDRGIHYSDRLGRDTMSLVDRGTVRTMVGFATEKGSIAAYTTGIA